MYKTVLYDINQKFEFPIPILGYFNFDYSLYIDLSEYVQEINNTFYVF